MMYPQSSVWEARQNQAGIHPLGERENHCITVPSQDITFRDLFQQLYPDASMTSRTLVKIRTSADALTIRNPLWTNVADLNSAGAFAALTAWGTRQIEFHIAPTVEEATVPERRRSADVMMQERNRPYLPDAKVITDTDQTHGG